MTEASADITTSFRRLGMAGVVLQFGAHPDDEDAGLITYMARKHAVRVVYWSATRGEGGQNRIGPYKAEALGIYRTWESLAARALDGGEALFGPFYDFGFAKNGEETQQKWGRRGIVSELVRAIRFVQPHIVISRWTGTSADGHGHHQAIGALVPEAFEAAADPAQFPELNAQGLGAWSATKLYVSMEGDWQPGETITLGRMVPEYETAEYVRINSGEFDPLLGRTYQEQAWAAFNKHRTQGIGFAPEHGDHYYYYRLVRSTVSVPKRERTFFEGFDPSLVGLADHQNACGQVDREVLVPVQNLAERAFRLYLEGNLQEAAHLLLEGRHLLEELSSRLSCVEECSAIAKYLVHKGGEFNDLAVRCLGLKLDCQLDRARISPGQAVRVSVRLWNPLGLQSASVDLAVEVPAGWEVVLDETSPSSLSSSHLMMEVSYRVKSPATADLSCPYWLRRPRSPYRYSWPEPPPLEHPFGPPLIAARCRIGLGQRDILMHAPGRRREAFPGGYRELPLSVIPPISFRPKSLNIFLPTGAAEKQLELLATARSSATDDGAADGLLTVDAPPGWRVTPSAHTVLLSTPDDLLSLSFAVQVPAGEPAGRYPLRYVVRCGEAGYDTLSETVRAGEHAMEQPDESSCLREEYVTAPAVLQVHLIDVTFARGYRYAYVKGAAESIIDALDHFGVEFHLISDNEMGYLDFGQFDAIVIGPDAYLTRDELRKNASRFLKYVAGGGTLIVQYQNYTFQSGNFCPYPFRFNQPHDRITVADAPVTVIRPEHFVFHVPNQIVAADFADWVQDRGMYFFGEWDQRYEACLACNDPGEEPKMGGLLITGYGRGTYVYTGYSFHRQIPAGVSGAFRLFANLLGIPEARIRERVGQLKSVPMLADLRPEQLEQAARLVGERWLTDGAYLCHEGEAGHELFVVLSGEIEVIKELTEQPRIIYRAGPGETIGELAVLADIPRTAALRAKGRVHMLTMEGRQFRALMHTNPAMTDRIIGVLVRRLSGVAD